MVAQSVAGVVATLASDSASTPGDWQFGTAQRANLMAKNQQAQLVAAVLSGDRSAWSRFVELAADTVFSSAATVFPDYEVEAEALALFEALRRNEFAALRDYDGQADLKTFLALKLADLLVERILGLLTENAERGWAAFQEFFGDDIRRIVARRFRGLAGASALDDGSSVDDKIQDVLEKLIENDFRRLRSYSGSGSFAGYLRRTVTHICADLSRAMIGRRRLPAPVEKMPAVEQSVFKELYWHGTRRDDLHRVLRSVDGQSVDAPVVEAAADRVSAVVGCRAQGPSRPTMANTVRLDSMDGSGAAAAASLADAGTNPEEALLSGQANDAVEDLMSALRRALDSLPQEARLYLHYRFIEEPPLAPRQIAPLLSLPVEEIYRKRKSWELALLNELKAHGVENLAALSV